MSKHLQRQRTYPTAQFLTALNHADMCWAEINKAAKFSCVKFVASLAALIRSPTAFKSIAYVP